MKGIRLCINKDMMRSGYRKLVIACNSYKGCLTSRAVNDTIAGALSAPEIITLEMSDGGEGMLDAFLSAMKGERVRIHAHDALMRWTEAGVRNSGQYCYYRDCADSRPGFDRARTAQPDEGYVLGCGRDDRECLSPGRDPFHRGIGRKCHFRLRYRNAQGYGRRLEDDTQGMQLCAGFRRYQSSLRRERRSSCLCSSKGSRL